MQPGDIIRLRAGLKVWHMQGREITSLQTSVLAEVLSVRNHTRCGFATVRALDSDQYRHPEGAIVTFATWGKIGPTFKQAPVAALRRTPKDRKLQK